MSRRYSYSTCLSFGTDGEADYCEIDTTISFTVIAGDPETGPSYACGGTPATGDLVEDIRVETIDGQPAVTGDAITREAILAEFECGRHDADLLAHAGEVDWADGGGGMSGVKHTRGPIWSCKIGVTGSTAVPVGGDSPMRRAVDEAFQRLIGKHPDFIFSGWSAELTEPELAVVEGRWPSDEHIASERIRDAAPDLLDACVEAAKIFRRYEALHLEKGTVDGAQKAEANASHAKSLEAIITRATGDRPEKGGAL